MILSGKRLLFRFGRHFLLLALLAALFLFVHLGKVVPLQKEILAKVASRIHELKQLLRAGANEKDFDKLGLLLSAYDALQKVVTKINP